MQQLTFVEYAALMWIKDEKKRGLISDNLIQRLTQFGLIRKTENYYKIIPGKRYNYRGNTYTL